MALIIIRSDNNEKMLNAIADVERHAGLNITTKIHEIGSEYGDKIVSSVLNQKLRNKSKVATAFFVKEDTTLSIMKIKKIHPPAHIVVLSEEYEDYESFKSKIAHNPTFSGYYSHKSKNKKDKESNDNKTKKNNYNTKSKNKNKNTKNRFKNNEK
ncbi:MAG: DUF356 domain-containing protein [Methanobacteriaceae archaeon]